MSTLNDINLMNFEKEKINTLIHSVTKHNNMNFQYLKEDDKHKLINVLINVLRERNSGVLMNLNKDEKRELINMVINLMKKHYNIDLVDLIKLDNEKKQALVDVLINVMAKQLLKEEQNKKTSNHLTRCYEILNRESCFSNSAKKQYIVPPEISFLGKKTKINNINEIATILNRDLNTIHEHLQKELHLQINIQGDNSFILIGRAKPRNIEKAIKTFIISNIQCKMCRSLHTVVKREEKINYVCCDNCKAKRAIK
jgi:translation initiation factor 2 beta subunit (eIF-2beta)/eIF-5